MRKQRILVPKPRSNFLLVQCINCGNEQTIFTYVNIDARCQVCDSVLAEKKGGKAKINGVPLRQLD